MRSWSTDGLSVFSDIAKRAKIELMTNKAESMTEWLESMTKWVELMTKWLESMTAR